MAQVQSVVEILDLRTGLQRLGSRACHGAAGRRDVGVEADTRRRQHCGAPGRGLDIVRPGDGQARHVRANLPQQVAARPTPHADDLGRGMARCADGLEHVA